MTTKDTQDNTPVQPSLFPEFVDECKPKEDSRLEEIRENMKKTIEAYESNPEEAIKLLSNVILLDSKNGEAYSKRGRLRFAKGQLKFALNDLNQANELCNDDNTELINQIKQRLKAEEEKEMKKVEKELRKKIENKGQDYEQIRNEYSTQSEEMKLKETAKKNSYNFKINNDINSQAREYFYKAISKKDANDFVGAIEDLNKAIDAFPAFPQAYIYRSTCKELTGNYHIYELDSDIDKAAIARRSLKKLDEDRTELETRFKDNQIKGEELVLIINHLSKDYSVSEVAIACGYFKFNLPSKKEDLDLLILKYSLKALEKIELTPSLEEFEREKNIAFEKYNGAKEYEWTYSIFKNRLCHPDEDHGGTVYIPTRLVNESKDWDYSKANLKDWNIENIVNERFPSEDDLPCFLERANCTKEDAEEYKIGLEKEAQQLMEHYSFNEPMKYMHVNQYWFLNDHLGRSGWFDDEEIAEFHGLRYEDCHAASTWCDG